MHPTADLRLNRRQLGLVAGALSLAGLLPTRSARAPETADVALIGQVLAAGAPGDVVHVVQSGAIQSLTDVVIDPAGNVWAANNWNCAPPVLDNVPAWPTSTWGGGSGFTVIYGVAAPVQAPLMGHARKAQRPTQNMP